MITAFFKPKSAKKVTPAPSSSNSSSSSMPNKRALENGAETESSNKRSKQSSNERDNGVSPVQELLSYLHAPEKSDDDESTVAWTDVLSKHFSTPSFERLAKFVSAQRYVPVLSVTCTLSYDCTCSMVRHMLTLLP